MTFAANDGGRGNKTPAPQKIARQVTIAARPAPHYSQPAPAPVQHYSQPAPVAQSNSGGSYTSGGGAPQAPSNPNPGVQHGVGHNPHPAPPPPPPPPSIQKFLAGDTNYQDTLSNLMDVLTKFKSGINTQRGDLKDAFATAQSRMNDEKTKALSSLQDDFASRGLLNSGEYVKSNDDLLQQYLNQFNDLQTNQTQQMSDLQQQLADKQDLIAQQRQQARADAIAQRAQKYGLKG